MSAASMTAVETEGGLMMETVAAVLVCYIPIVVVAAAAAAALGVDMSDAGLIRLLNRWAAEERLACEMAISMFAHSRSAAVSGKLAAAVVVEETDAL